MSIVLNKKNINSIFISILIFICVLVPSDIYNFKKNIFYNNNRIKYKINY